MAHTLCVPRRHSAGARPFAKTGVEKVSTRHVENVRHVNSHAARLKDGGIRLGLDPASIAAPFISSIPKAVSPAPVPPRDRRCGPPSALPPEATSALSRAPAAETDWISRLTTAFASQPDPASQP